MRNRPAVLALAVVLLVAAGAAAAYALFLRGDNVAPLALPSANPSAVARASGSASAATGSAGASAVAPSLATASSAPVDAAALPGTWAVAPDSVVGYRVRERLANLSADSDAVGRTNTITGSATVAAAGTTGFTVSAATFSVDMTTLTSDRSMRDNRLRRDGIETDTFPTSTFTLTEPVTVPATITSGGQIDVTLHGDLTLHGVTKTVDIPARAQLSGGLIQIAGSVSFPFSDYAINAPNIAGFVAVEDTGTLEFLVNLTKS
ncbi:MAG TPA: YceI family protein [Patescibacteria group bacterium]|nr:YceI family protein [Patescibacteria group bacterium]